MTNPVLYSMTLSSTGCPTQNTGSFKSRVGVLYQITTSGVVNYSSGNGYKFDGLYTRNPNVSSSNPANWYDNSNHALRINGVKLSTQNHPYSPSHTYHFIRVGNGSAFTFKFDDDNCSDNSGTLNVEIRYAEPDAVPHTGCDCETNHACNDLEASPDPISLRDGEKREQVTDLVVNTAGEPLTFARSYRQFKQDVLRSMGAGWHHNHEISLDFAPSIGDLALNTSDGGQVFFDETSPGSNEFTAVASAAKIVYDGSQFYTLTGYSNTVRIFDNNGKLLEYRWPTGERWTYSYYSGGALDGLLQSVQDEYGRSLQFSYKTPTWAVSGISPQLWRVGDHLATGLDGDNPAGRFVEFDYIEQYDDGGPVSGDSVPLLRSVRDVRAQTWQYQYYGEQSGEAASDAQADYLTQVRVLEVDSDGDDEPDGDLIVKTLAYDFNGTTLEKITQYLGGDASAHLQKTEYDFTGSDTTVETTEGRSITHRFFGNGLYLGPEDGLNHASDKFIGADYRPIELHDANGNITQIDWTAGGKKLKKLTNADNQITEFVYDGDNAGDRLTVSTPPAGPKTYQVYDGAHRQPTLTLTADRSLTINTGLDVSTESDAWSDVGATSDYRPHHVDSGVHARFVDAADGAGIQSDTLNLVAGRTYTVQARVYRLSGSSPVTVQLSGAVASATSSGGTEAWETLTLSYTPGSSENRGIEIVADGGAAQFYVDRVIVTEAQDIAINGDMEIDDHWFAIGSPTHNRSNTRAYDGTYSWYVDASADEGIEGEAFDLVADRRYTLQAQVYVESGTVRMQIADVPGSSVYTASSGGWETLTLRHVPGLNQEDVIVQFLAEGGSAEFYVDAVAITEEQSLDVNGEMETTQGWSGLNSPTIDEVRPYAISGAGLYHVPADSGEGIASPAVTLAVGETYLALARVYLVNAQAVNLRVTTASGSSVLASADTNKVGQWQTLRAKYVVGSGDGGSRNVQFIAAANGAEFYVDTVHLIGLGTLTEPDDIAQLVQWQDVQFDVRGRAVEEVQFNLQSMQPIQRLTRSYYSEGSGHGLLKRVEQEDLEGTFNTAFTEYRYDSAGRVIETRQGSTFGSCEAQRTLYDAAGNVVSSQCIRNLDDVNDPVKSPITSYGYDALGRQVTVTTFTGVTSTPALQQTTRTLYDAMSRVTMTIANYQPQGSSAPGDWQWADDVWEYTTGQAVSHGSHNDENIVTVTDYNKRGFVRRQRDVIGRVRLLGYDAADRLVKIIQNASSPAYNNAESAGIDLSGYGTPSAAADADLIIQQTYDASGNLVKAIDALGQVTFTVYDSLNRPVKVVRNAKDEATLDYNPGDVNYNADHDPRSGSYVFSDDPDRDQVETTEYDSLGRVMRTQVLKETRPDAVWDTTLLGYDTLGRQVKAIRHASDPDYDLSVDADLSDYTVSGEVDEDQVSTTTYNNQGQVQDTTDVNQSVTRLVYDGLNRQSKTIGSYLIQGSSDPTDWLWDSNDTRWEDGAGNAIDFGDENDQNVIAETVYDSDGRVLSTRDMLGRVTYNVYDLDGRLIRRIGSYVAQGASDPADWLWDSNDEQWEDGASNAIERRSDPTNHPDNHDQNVITDTVYDDEGRVQATIDVRQNVTRFVYDMLGRRVMTISNYVAQANPPEAWEWDANDNRWEDGSGNAINRGSDNDQNVISFTQYDLAGRVELTRDAAGVVTYSVYDAAGRRIRSIQNYVAQGMTDPADWLWDANDVRWEDGAGSAIAHGSAFDQNLISDTIYNKGGQVITTRDARGTLTSFSYDDAGRRLTVTRAANSSLATTDYTCFDKAGRVLRTIGHYITDGVNNPDEQDGSGDWLFDPPSHGAYHDRNRITAYAYDKADRRVSVTDPVGNVTETTYFKDGQVKLMTQKAVEVDGTPTDVVTQYRYDKLRRRNLVVQGFVDNGEDPENWVWDGVTDNRWEESDGTAIVHGSDNDQNVIVQVTRDIAGRMLSLRDPRGNETTYTYDLLNRRLTQTNPLSNVWKSAYNDLEGGTRTIMTYPGLSAGGAYDVEREFDRLGRLKAITYDQLSVTPDVVFSYDAAGNRQQMTETGSSGTVRETTFSYDAMHRLTQVDFDTDGVGGVDETVTYEYDTGGLKTRMTLPGSLDITYTYDAKGRLVGLTDWDDNQATFEYDAADRHIITSRHNAVTPALDVELRSDYRYDPAGRLLRLWHHRGTRVLADFRYTVDARGNRTQVEELLQLAAGTVTTTAGDLDPVTGWTLTGGFLKATSFGARLAMPFTGQDSIELTMGTGPDHSIFDVYINGSLWQSFDGYAASESEMTIPIQINGTGPHVLEIRNRADGNPQSSGYVIRFKLLSVGAAYTERTIQYTYDALSRLIEADYDSGDRVYDFNFDLAGNRLQEALSGTGVTAKTTDYEYNTANQIDRMRVDGGAWTDFTYDNNGNLTGDGVNAYTWDRANRLIEVDNGTPAELSVYVYDGLGNRISQAMGTSSPVVTQYLLDTQPGLVKVLAQTTGANTDRFIHAPRGIHAIQNNAGDWSFMAQDGLGSVRSEIDSLLNVLAVQNYAPYGETFGSVGSFASPFEFTGEQTDPTGQVYLRARYYNPSLGVFPSLDPFEGMIDRPMSLNGYSWVEGNTPNMVDPSGNCVDDWICRQLRNTNPSAYEDLCHSQHDAAKESAVCDQFITDIQQRITRLQSECTSNGIPGYCDRSVALMLSEYYSAMRFDSVGTELRFTPAQEINQLLTIWSGYRIYPSAEDLHTERFPVEVVGGLSAGPYNPLYIQNDIVGRQRRAEYGFRREFFQNTHHFFALFGIAVVAGIIPEDYIDWRREGEGVCLEAKRYCNGESSREEFAWFYQEAAMDRHVAQIAGLMVASLLSPYGVGPIRDLPEYLRPHVCATKEGEIWENFDRIMGSSPYKDFHPDTLDCNIVQSMDCRHTITGES